MKALEEPETSELLTHVMHCRTNDFGNIMMELCYYCVIIRHQNNLISKLKFSVHSNSIVSLVIICLAIVLDIIMGLAY